MSKRKSRTQVKNKSKLFDPSRKQDELLGSMLILFGVLILMGLFTYDPSELPQTAKIGQVKNALGIVGVYISHYLIRWTIGYPVLFFPFVLVAWGFNRFFGKDVTQLIKWSVFVTLISFFVSVSGALLNLISANQTTTGFHFSGFIGTWTARILTTIFSTYGAVVILIGLMAITLMAFTALSFAECIQLVSSYIMRLLLAISRWFRRFKPSIMDQRSIDRWEKETSHEPELVYEQPRPRPSPSPEAEPNQQAAAGGGRTLHLNLEAPQQKRTESSTKSESPPSPATEAAAKTYTFPELDYLQPPQEVETDIDEKTLKQNADLLEEKLADFDIRARVIEIYPGPVITRYELELAPGIKVSRITSLADDLAMAMRAKRIRIVAPIPGKAAIGIEIPNAHPAVVYLREIIESKEFQQSDTPLTLALGKTASGKPFVTDLQKMPHLLVAGSTGSGKSVCLNCIIASILYKSKPEDVQFIMIDPKRLELSTYNVLYRHHLQYVDDLNERVATSPKSAIAVLKATEQEMERRYELMAKAGVRNIEEFNVRARQGRIPVDGEEPIKPICYLVLIIDELADLMMTSSASRDVEEPIARLTQMSRAVGIHLILATQRPSVDVITGVIKANFPARIAFQVASKVDSRTILDMNGAEKLLGRGDMLFLPPASPEPYRLHNAFISLEETETILDHIAHQPPYEKKPLPGYSEEQAAVRNGGRSNERDALFNEALRIVVYSQQGSVSIIQRKLKVGYSRAARLIDELEAAGIVGPFEGSKAREVLVTPEELEDMGYGQYIDEE